MPADVIVKHEWDCFAASSLWTTSVERRVFLPARTARTEKASWHLQLCMTVSPTCLRKTEVSGHSFCNVAMQGLLEHVCDLFHIFDWVIVRRDGPRTLVCQREMRDVTVTTVAYFVGEIP